MMNSATKTLYASFFTIFSLAFIQGQSKVPFGVVKAEEGYAMVRVPKDNYRKIVDKIRMRKGDVFVYVKPAPGETEWIWIKYPEKQDDDKPFVRYETLDKEGMVNKDRIAFIDQLPQFTPSKSKNGRSLIFTDNSNPKIPAAQRTKVIIDVYPSNAGYRKQEKDANGNILTIDKVKPWGISSQLPEGMTEIKSIRVQQPGRGSVFVREAIKNMFQPTMDFNNVGVTSIDNDHIFLYMINGSGENRYTTLWTIKEGRVISQIIYKNPE
ncbi:MULTISPECIES: hypothetical protein [Chryseobacterium]|uniref:SH3 domain-containing protein n=1 Tax=Chryseobacterium camelliae TaxID=1265445 RepID=A0ABU0TJ07_9FLAO|nr:MULTISPECIES: hypothetical protein [Chryseobacterium]MDT3409112.1 hypothetical protein [Pseudacidovorax intermedius]MDQ1097030.1 hypothetical protein [Chryseobacterium camelliae]MDQ1100969.1 hypothetical protein [Chryseobacterium sp. SORGH_AS_1048]MDR6084411.1 hypothetical protein [Chryseobacterium sp. SORGH_AS_0909]MDR6132682.1 hypothetical protein [Chryseobacterium sp. SORGH_AS_1175]